MSTTHWRSFGASVIGPGHMAAQLPNQDAWLTFHEACCNGIVVADGLGSRPHADVGSRAACVAVERAVRRCGDAGDLAWPEGFLDRLHTEWLTALDATAPRDAATTCLFAVRANDGVIRMGALGDGGIALLRHDGTVISMMEDKEHSFSNLTSALSPQTMTDDWQVYELPEVECRAVAIFTDGVGDDLDDVAGFVRTLVDALGPLASAAACEHAAEILEAWPVPKHTDDKTIACLIREESNR